jgi:hypothetical protein
MSAVANSVVGWVACQRVLVMDEMKEGVRRPKRNAGVGRQVREGYGGVGDNAAELRLVSVKRRE